MTDTNGTHGLILPRVEVMLDDGRTVTVQVLNVDLLRWDRTAAKHGWPSFETARVMHQTFLAWSALRRVGEIPDEWTWEQFGDTHCLQVQGVDANGNAPAEGEEVEPETADPIPAGVAPA